MNGVMMQTIACQRKKILKKPGMKQQITLLHKLKLPAGTRQSSSST